MAMTKEQYANAVKRRNFKIRYETDGKVYKFCSEQGEFKPYMHFVKHLDGTATVYIWDTREVVKHCNQSELPGNYQEIKNDTYEYLKTNSNSI